MAKTGRLMESSGSVTAYAPMASTMETAHAVADLELAGGHHLIAGGKAFDDLDPALAARAGHHLGELHLAVDDLEHELAVALRHDRLLRHAQGVFLELEEHRHPREQARTQTLIGIRNHGPDQEAAAGDIETRIDGVDLALEALVGEGVDLDANGLPHPDGGQEFLRHPEIGLHRIDRLEIDQRLAGGDVFADAHMAQADDAGERRHDMRLLELHAGELDGGGADGEIGRRLVGRLGGRVFAAEQLAGSLVGLLGELELGLGVGELGAIDRIVEREERRALLDRLTLLEMDLLEAAGNLRADGDRLVGKQRADRGHLLAQRRGDHSSPPRPARRRSYRPGPRRRRRQSR